LHHARDRAATKKKPADLDVSAERNAGRLKTEKSEQVMHAPTRIGSAEKP